MKYTQWSAMVILQKGHSRQSEWWKSRSRGTGGRRYCLPEWQS